MNCQTALRPHDFDRVFVQHGWRGVENFFGARTPVNCRWLKEAGETRLRALRKRYRDGDITALEEVVGRQNPGSAVKLEGWS